MAATAPKAYTAKLSDQDRGARPPLELQCSWDPSTRTESAIVGCRMCETHGDGQDGANPNPWKIGWSPTVHACRFSMRTRRQARVETLVRTAARFPSHKTESLTSEEPAGARSRAEKRLVSVCSSGAPVPGNGDRAAIRNRA